MDTLELLQQYLDICDAAIEANKERFPFKQILSAAQENERQEDVLVQIGDQYPPERFIIHAKDHKVSEDSSPECEDCSCGAAWRVSSSFLKNVVENPLSYIENPARLDWEWLFSSQL